jgi:hypothetical protein
MSRKTALLTLIALVGSLFIGAYGGYLYGERVGGEKIRKLIDIVYPQPPKEMYELDGLIVGTDVDTVTLEIQDPNDYLPHIDGTDSLKQRRVVSITSTTKIMMADQNTLDANGEAVVTSVKFSDIKVGVRAIVKSLENIKDATSFSANEIEVFKN